MTYALAAAEELAKDGIEASEVIDLRTFVARPRLRHGHRLGDEDGTAA